FDASSSTSTCSRSSLPQNPVVRSWVALPSTSSRPCLCTTNTTTWISAYRAGERRGCYVRVRSLASSDALHIHCFSLDAQELPEVIETHQVEHVETVGLASHQFGWRKWERQIARRREAAVIAVMQ